MTTTVKLMYDNRHVDLKVRRDVAEKLNLTLDHLHDVLVGACDELHAFMSPMVPAKDAPLVVRRDGVSYNVYLEPSSPGGDREIVIVPQEHLPNPTFAQLQDVAGAVTTELRSLASRKPPSKNETLVVRAHGVAYEVIVAGESLGGLDVVIVPQGRLLDGSRLHDVHRMTATLEQRGGGWWRANALAHRDPRPPGVIGNTSSY